MYIKLYTVSMTTISAINAFTFSKSYYVTNTSLIIIVLFCLLFCHETEDFVYYLIIAQMGCSSCVRFFSIFFVLSIRSNVFHRINLLIILSV
jgi:hypothetical protein